MSAKASALPVKTVAVGTRAYVIDAANPAGHGRSIDDRPDRRAKADGSVAATGPLTGVAAIAANHLTTKSQLDTETARAVAAEAMVRRSLQ